MPTFFSRHVLVKDVPGAKTVPSGTVTSLTNCATLHGVGAGVAVQVGWAGVNEGVPVGGGGKGGVMVGEIITTGEAGSGVSPPPTDGVLLNAKTACTVCAALVCTMAVAIVVEFR